MTKVFVTGANGLLGTNLILMLSKQGYQITALVRNKKNFINPNIENLKLKEGDLLNTELLNKEIKTCNYVVHIAANTSQNLFALKDYYPANVQGTKNIINSCLKNNIEKLVYIGTANTYGFGSLTDLGNENKPMKYPFTKAFYALSKKEAQDIIDNAVNQLNITTISPTFMIGAYDTKPSSGKIILTILNKRIGFYPTGGKNFVHVKDVANSIIKSFELKESGQKFILANENLSYQEFFKKVIRINNQKTTLIPLNKFALRIVGLFGDSLRLLRIKTDISSRNTKILTVDNYYTNKKASTELNIEFTSIDNAINDALKYFQKAIIDSD